MVQAQHGAEQIGIERGMGCKEIPVNKPACKGGRGFFHIKVDIAVRHKMENAEGKHEDAQPG